MIDLPNHPLFNLLMGIGGAILFAGGLLRFIEIEPLEEEEREVLKTTEVKQDIVTLQLIEMTKRVTDHSDMLISNYQLENQELIERALIAEREVAQLKQRLESINKEDA